MAQRPALAPEGPARPEECSAAFSSRSITSPQEGQTWVRTPRDSWARAPHSATVLRGIGGWHGDHSTPGACCLGFEDGAERRPARIADALGEAASSAPCWSPANLRDRSCRSCAAGPAPSCGGSRAAGAAPAGARGPELHRLLATCAALLPAARRAAGLWPAASPPCGSAADSRPSPRPRDEEHLQADVDARLAAGQGQRLGAAPPHTRCRRTSHPPRWEMVTVLGCLRAGRCEPHGDTPDLRQDATAHRPGLHRRARPPADR